MGNGNTVSGALPLPKEFFTAGMLGTLSGAVFVTWIVSGLLSGVFQTDPKLIGLIVSMGVAYLGLFLSKNRRTVHYLVTFFNGLLIYATVVGGTSFLPFVNKGTASVTQEKTTSTKSALTRPWVPDKNLLIATSELLEINEEQQMALNGVTEHIEAVQHRLEALGEEPAITPAQRKEFVDRLIEVQRRIEETDAAVEERSDILMRTGVKPLPSR